MTSHIAKFQLALTTLASGDEKLAFVTRLNHGGVKTELAKN